MRIVCLSDTHFDFTRVKVPDGDVLVFAGDATYQGRENELTNFNKNLAVLPHEHKLIIAGNHDWMWYRDVNKAKSIVTAATYLEDSSVTIDGFKFYGSPWQPEFCNWAFNLPRGKEIKAKWDLIPDDTDVLITHGPPFGILDLTPRGEKVGCADLFQRVLEVHPQLHVFGHIHQSHGQVNFNGTTFVNAAICDEQYRHTNDPIVIDLE